jgi:SSS family solute:Na+ symporter
VTVIVSLLTKQKKTEEELTGLVYSLTPRPKEKDVTWFQRPAFLAIIVGAIAIVLSLIFW